LSMVSFGHDYDGMGEPPDEAGLGYLLDLNGWVSEVGGGFWIKVCVYKTAATASVPHGISYSLTMHKPSGERVIGYDNAHPFSERRGLRRAAMPFADHRHYRDRIEPYSFVSAERLTEDFWHDVERFLREEGVTPDAKGNPHT
jgi:hypothetical protein